MLDQILEIESLSLVFLGEFNPIIISPTWLAFKNLIREEEGLNADVKVIHADIAQFELDWTEVVITRKRCEFKCNKPPYFETVRDLGSSIFNILQETPINALGINHIYEIKLPTEESYYKFGANLTNLNLWDNTLNDARMMTLEILEQKRQDKFDGRYRVRISPTAKDIRYGVSININDHINLNGNAPVETLSKVWVESFKRARYVTENLLTKLKL